MKVTVIRHIATREWAHYPGQVLVDVPYERELLESGAGVAEKEEPEVAVLPVVETADFSPARRPGRPAKHK